MMPPAATITPADADVYAFIGATPIEMTPSLKNVDARDVLPYVTPRYAMRDIDIDTMSAARAPMRKMLPRYASRYTRYAKIRVSVCEASAMRKIRLSGVSARATLRSAVCAGRQ